MGSLASKLSQPLPPYVSSPQYYFNNEYQAAWLEDIQHHPSFPWLLGQMRSAAPRPTPERKDRAAQKMMAAPQGRASGQEQKGTPCKPGPGIGHNHINWGRGR